MGAVLWLDGKLRIYFWKDLRKALDVCGFTGSWHTEGLTLELLGKKQRERASYYKQNHRAINDNGLNVSPIESNFLDILYLLSSPQIPSELVS